MTMKVEIIQRFTEISEKELRLTVTVEIVVRFTVTAKIVLRLNGTF